MSNVDEITIQDNYLSWQGSIIYAFEGNQVLIPANNILVDKSDCGYILTFPHIKASDIIGLALSREAFSTVVIDERDIISFKNSKHYYKKDGYLLKDGFINSDQVNSCSRPIAHLVGDTQTYSWSTPSECVISLYNDNYKPYVRFECIAYSNHQFFLDISSHYLINCQRYPLDRPTMLLNSYSGKHHVKQALLLGAIPRGPIKPDAAIKQTQDIQRELRSRNIESVLIGGLARRLNGIIADVTDIDLMTKDIEQFERASQVISNFADEVQATDKYKTFLLSNTKIDLSYDNFHVLPGFAFTIQRHDISYLSLEGLWILYSTNLMQTRFEEHTEDYTRHIEDCLFSICSSMDVREYMIRPMKDCKGLGERCCDLCEMMVESKMLYSDVRINQPFQVNGFLGSDILYCPIVNLGSPQKAQIILPQKIKSVTLHALSGNELCSAKLIHETAFSIIRTGIIQHGALLVCQL